MATRIHLTDTVSALVYRFKRQWVRALVLDADGPQAVPFQVTLHRTKREAAKLGC